MSQGREMVYYELVGLREAQVRPGEAQMRPGDPPAGIDIRTAVGPADYQVIAELYNAAFERAMGQVTAADVAHYARHPGLAVPGVLMAFDGALAVGMIVGRLDVPAPGGQVGRAAVELLVVRPGYRRRRIAALLLGRLLAMLAAAGVDTVGAMVGPSGSRHGISTLLEQYGFRRVIDEPGGDWGG